MGDEEVCSDERMGVEEVCDVDGKEVDRDEDEEVEWEEDVEVEIGRVERGGEEEEWDIGEIEVMGELLLRGGIDMVGRGSDVEVDVT